MNDSTPHFRLEVKTIKRAEGGSMVAKAAYSGGLCLHDNRTGVRHDYTRRQPKIYKYATVVPPGCEVFQEAAALWNEAEASEKRCDSWVGRELITSHPCLLSDEANWTIALQFARWLCATFQIGVQANFHLSGLGDPRNKHSHFDLTTRRLTPSGLTSKLRNWDVSTTSDEIVETLRKEWCDITNKALEKAGHKERLDHRSYERQGIDREPGVHLGKQGSKLVRMRRSSMEEFVARLSPSVPEEIIERLHWLHQHPMRDPSESLSGYAPLFRHDETKGYIRFDPDFITFIEQRLSGTMKKRKGATVVAVSSVFRDAVQQLLNVLAAINALRDEARDQEKEKILGCDHS